MENIMCIYITVDSDLSVNQNENDHLMNGEEEIRGDWCSYNDAQTVYMIMVIHHYSRKAGSEFPTFLTPCLNIPT